MFAPVISIAGEYAGSPSLKQDLAAIAVVFQFVNPVFPLWRLVDRSSKLWFDKPMACDGVRHEGFDWGESWLGGGIPPHCAR